MPNVSEIAMSIVRLNEPKMLRGSGQKARSRLFQCKHGHTVIPGASPRNADGVAGRGCRKSEGRSVMERIGLVGAAGGRVFAFPNDTLCREDCLKYQSRRVTGFHFGGKTPGLARYSPLYPGARTAFIVGRRKS